MVPATEAAAVIATTNRSAIIFFMLYIFLSLEKYAIFSAQLRSKNATGKETKRLLK